MQLCVAIVVALLLRAFAYDVALVVDDAVDGPVSTLDCTDGNTCNFRSAWASCQNHTFTTCTISLLAETTYAIDSTYGPLELQPWDNITIQGGNETVVAGAGTQLVTYFSGRYTNDTPASYPSLTLKDLTVVGFGGFNVTGGAVMFSGEGELTLDNVDFTQNFGSVGGAVFLQDSTKGITITNCNFHANNASEGGAIALNSFNHNMAIADSTFSDNQADNRGGDIYVGLSNSNIALRRLAMERGTAAFGGAVFIDSDNSDITMAQTSFTTCQAATHGGALYLDSENADVTIADTKFDKCAAQAGGAVFIRQSNHHVLFKRTTFSHCVANGGHGGAVNTQIFNSHIEYVDSTFTDCSATSSNGGGVYLNGYNTEVSVVGTRFVRCSAGISGGAVHAEVRNHNLLLRDTKVLSCTAAFGGGLNLAQRNLNTTIDGSFFEGCTATNRGGAIFADSFNDNTIIADTLISGCRTTLLDDREGGGIFSGRNSNTRILNSEIRGCTAGFGGGLLLHAAQQIAVVDTTFESNTAIMGGGGIASYPQTRGLVIAGCDFLHNQANGTDGGAVLLTGGNAQFLITDSNTATRLQVVESEHPYENIALDGVILGRTVSDPEALGFILHFDTDSALGSEDEVAVYDQGGNQVFSVDYDGAWPGRDLAPLRVDGNSFTVRLRGTPHSTSKADSLYGFRLYVAPILVRTGRETVFKHNRAESGRGGGFHTTFFLRFAVIMNAQFRWNEAWDGGGAMSLRSAATGVTIERVVFEENTSGRDGGALHVESGAGGLLVKDCIFASNSATNGGAVALVVANGHDNMVLSGEDTGVTFSNCSMNDNTAVGLGGALYLDRDNWVAIDGGEIAHNSADSGGGIYAASLNSVALSNASLVFNYASRNGGGLSLGGYNLAGLKNTHVTSNTAGMPFATLHLTISLPLCFCHVSSGHHGGGIYQEDSSWFVVEGESVLDRNEASDTGGAVASFKSGLWMSLADSATLHITRNRAQRGSALYHRAGPGMPTRLERLIIADNTASVGGTVYWLYEEGGLTEEPPGLNDSSVVWEGNVAPYGEITATQAVSIDAPDTYAVTTYAKELSPALVFSLRDYYGTVIPWDRDTKFTVSLGRTIPQHCSGRAASLSGVLTEPYHHNASFTALQAVCAPEGGLTLTVEALLDLVEAPNTVVNTTVTLSFRSCQRGEFIKDGRCEVCPRGSYSLAYPVTDSTSCKDCTKKNGVTDCYGDVIEVSAGYWRRHNTSEAVLDCLGDANGCAGGNGAGNALCAAGYQGPLCAVCADGYYSSNGLCEVCGSGTELNPTVVTFLAIAGVICAIAALFFYSKCLRDIPDATNTEVQNLTIFQRSRAWLHRKYKELRAQFKILITTYQIVSTVPGNLDVEFPSSFTSFLKAFSVFNLNVISVVPFACTNHYTFIDKLVASTLFPLALTLLLALLWLLEAGWQATRSSWNDSRVQQQLDALKDQYLTYFFFLTYLVLPSVSTTIFQTFLCTNVDPRGEDNDASDSYLIADMSISCNSPYYYKGVVYAVAMLLVYVVGIPLMYFVVLYYNREEIAQRDAPLAVEGSGDPLLKPEQVQDSGGASADAQLAEPCGTRGVTSKAQRLSFLWDAYEPQYWYWEVVETTRRLMLTAVLSVCGAGSSAQSIFAVLLGLLYIKLYGFYAPYDADGDDILAETGQFQIFFTFLGALIYQNSLLGSQWNVHVSVALIVINAVITMVFTYFACLELRGDIEEYKSLKHMSEPTTPLCSPDYRDAPSWGNDSNHSQSIGQSEGDGGSLELRDLTPSSLSKEKFQLPRKHDSHFDSCFAHSVSQDGNDEV
jgi:hypothetical protein